jgi:hypothetical protein
MKATVNGDPIEIDDALADVPLLWVLRDSLALKGAKFGCGHGGCGACTVQIDGHAGPSCTTLTKDGRAGAAMWLLPARHAHGGLGTAGAGPEPDRCRDRRGDVVGAVPLRNLQAGTPRDSLGGAAQLGRCTLPGGADDLTCRAARRRDPLQSLGQNRA